MVKTFCDIAFSLRTGRSLIAFVVVCLLCTSLVSTVCGQVESSDADTALNALKSNARLPDILSEGTLEPKARLWFSDKDGNRVLVPDQSYEDYLKSSSRSAIGVAGLPAAAIQSLQASVEVRGDVAHVEASYEVRVTQESGISLNLRLGRVQLTEWSFSSPSGKNLIQPSRDDSGWLWILLDQAGSTQTAVLKGVSRVAREAGRRSLRLSLPNSPCTIKLKLPSNAVDLRVRSEDVIESTNSQDTVDCTVRSSGGEFTISWRDQEAVAQIAAVNASSRTEFVITDPLQPWIATTKLRLRWYGMDAQNEIRIRLPAGGQWRALPNSEFERFRIVSDDGTADLAGEEVAVDAAEQSVDVNPAAVQLVLENFDVTQTEAVELVLEWDWVPESPSKAGASGEIGVPTPSIEGVDQHEGTIDCIVPSAYSVVFREGQGAQLIQQGPMLDGFGRQQLQFAFDREPFELDVMFRRELSLPTVRPTYLVHVDRNKLLLTMWFDCSFDTNQQQMEIGLILDEWLIQENTARVVNDPTDPFSNEGEILRVRQQVDRNYMISGANADPGTFGANRHVDQVWRVVAERSWTADDNNELFFQVPRIIRGRANGSPETDHGSGTLLVTSDSNVLLKWQESFGPSLQQDSFSTEYQRYVRELGVRKPLAYRFQSSGETPVWAGRADLLPQQISVEQHVELEIIGSQVATRQNYELQVANEPLQELRFAVRKDAGDFQPPQVYVNGNLVSCLLVGAIDEAELEAMNRINDPMTARQPPSSEPMTPTGTVWQTYQLVGGPEFEGASRVTILTGVAWRVAKQSGAMDEGSTAVSVPLVQLLLPSETLTLRQDWTLQSDPQVEAVSSTEDGVSQDPILGGQRARPLSESDRSIELNLRPRSLLGVTSLRVGKSWLQTFVTGRRRRDRFVAEVLSSSTEFQFKLPAEANIRKQEVRVVVDGVEQAYQYDQQSDTVTVVLAAPQKYEHVIEVSYSLPDALAWVSQLNVAPPQIVGAEHVDRFYWQLITPAVQHLGWSPAEFTAEWIWSWSGMWWERRSTWDQARLEAWSETNDQEPPPASANSYVMSGRVPDEPFTVWILSRFILWFPVGIIAIAISFSALNFAFVRRPVFVFALAVCVAGLAMVWPDMAALAGQTAVLSLGLVGLVWVIQAAVDSRVRRRSVFTTRPSTYIERSEHFSIARGVRTAPPMLGTGGSSVGAAEGNRAKL